MLRHSPVDTAGHRLVLIALADKANDDGTGAYPSVATLARETRQSERNVQYALRALEQGGHIAAAGTSPHRTKAWRVEMPRESYHAASWPADADAKAPTSRDAKSAPPQPGRAQNTTDEGATVAPEPSLTAQTTEPPSQAQLDGSTDGSGEILGTPPPTASQAGVWARARDALEQRASESSWGLYLEDLRLAEVAAGHRWVITCPPHLVSTVRDRYLPMIVGEIRKAGDIAATVEISRRVRRAPAGAAGRPSPSGRPDTVSTTQEDERCTTRS